MEIATQQLTLEQLRGELRRFSAWLGERGVPSANVLYGWGCEESDIQYEAIPVATSDIEEYLERGRQAGFFNYGDADVLITADNSEFCLCHEADVHFKSEDRDLVEAVKAQWLSAGWTVHQQAEPGPEWTKL